MYDIVEYCNDRGRINNYCRSEQSAPSRPFNARPYAPQTNQLLSPNRKKMVEILPIWGQPLYLYHVVLQYIRRFFQIFM